MVGFGNYIFVFCFILHITIGSLNIVISVTFEMNHNGADNFNDNDAVLPVFRRNGNTKRAKTDTGCRDVG